MPVDALVNELLALGTLEANTADDLRAMQQAAAAGALDSDDEAYIRALHARLVGGAMVAAAANDTGPGFGAEPVLEGLSIAQWRERALAAEAEAQRLRDQLAGPA